jgi:acyl-CoA oxidase
MSDRLAASLANGMDQARNRLAVIAGHVTEASSSGGPASGHSLMMLQSTSAARESRGYTRNFPQATTAAEFPAAVSDALALDSLLTPEERALRKRVRQFMESEVAPMITDYWERAEFPYELPAMMRGLGIGGGTIKGYGCAGLSVTAAALATMELARVDASCATFYLVHTFLAMLTISLMGTEEQKASLLPDMAANKLVGCWALT